MSLCAEPCLVGAYDLSKHLVVVVDVLRATSTIVTALAHGVKQFVVVDKLEKCLSLMALGFITAGERYGKRLEGCDLGNSPLDFVHDSYAGEKIALTSTNGTQAILTSTTAKTLLLGAFVNLQAISDYLIVNKQPALVMCAGSQGNLSPEDLLFAGALCDRLQKRYTPSDDMRLAGQLYTQAKKDLFAYLSPFEHTQRLLALGLEEDIHFCLLTDKYQVLPNYERGYIESIT